MKEIGIQFYLVTILGKRLLPILEKGHIIKQNMSINIRKRLSID